MSSTPDNEFDRIDEQDEAADLRLESVKSLRPEDRVRPSKHSMEQQKGYDSRKKPSKYYHATGGRLDKDCPICALPTEIRQELQDQYVSACPMGVLVVKFGINVNWIKAHVRAFALEYERAKDTDRVYAVIADLGLKNIKQKPGEVTPEVLLKTLNWIDRREGRVVERVQVQAAPAIIFATEVPLPPPFRRAELQEPTRAVLTGGVLEASFVEDAEVKSTQEGTRVVVPVKGEVVRESKPR